MEDFLNRKRQFRFSLTLWQFGLIAGMALLLPYAVWEMYWYRQVGMAAIKWHTYLAFFAVLFWLLLMPVSFLSSVRNKMMLALVYLILCLIIGEAHPFTRVSMYNNFTKYAYSFKLTDNKENLIPFEKYYRVSSSALAHKFVVIAQELTPAWAYGSETPETLAIIGRELLKELQESKKTTPPADTLRLYLVRHYMYSDSLMKTEKLIYADRVWQ